MSTINVFQISFEIWGCIIGIIVCILLRTASFETEDVVGKKLWKMILINNLLLVSDALAYIYRGDLTPLGVTMKRICNFSLFALENLLLVIFVRYVRQITGTGEAKSTAWWEYLAYFLQAVGFAGLVITQFTGLYYSFDETNHYQRGSGIWINFAVCGAVILLCFFELWLHRKKLSKSETSTFLLCIAIFFLCIILQFVFYGLSLINIGMTIALLLVYLRHNKAQYDVYIKNSIDEAIRDTEALAAWKSVPDCAAEQTQEVQYEENKG